MQTKEIISKRYTILIILLLQMLLFISLYLQYPEERFTLLVTILSMIPALALFVVTFMYVRITNEILQDNQISRKKDFIKELIDNYLAPLLEDTRNEINKIITKSVFYVSNQEIKLRTNRLNYMFSGRFPEVYENLFNEYFPDILKEINKHDKKIKELEKRCEKNLTKIITKKLKDKWEKRIINYQKTAKKRDKIQLSEAKDILDQILESILNGNKSPMLSDFFWNKYEKNILEEREDIIKELKDINNELDEIKELSAEIKKSIINEIIHLQNKYGFILKEPMEII